jgi:alkanesulfonate monooxygenase SsuD/methylene tetrahydromethanopterin reductase-like flavin-dependent oxidoreductase (luciferase family)
MDVGIALPNAVPGLKRDVLLDWARKADASPFASLGVNDRLAWTGYEPLTALTAAAALTQRVKLITHIIISTFRPGGLLAKQVATLDALSGGRVVLGIGVGGDEPDFIAAPADFHRRGRTMEWQIAAMKRVWSGQPIADGVAPYGPVPGRPGGPPILIGGRTPNPLRRAGQLADGYIAGTGNSPQRMLEYYGVVEQAWKDAGRAGRPLMAAIDYYALGDAAIETGSAYIGEYYSRQGASADVMVERILKTPQSIKDAIKGFQDIGMDDYIIMPTAPTLDQFDRLAEVVGG